MRLHPTALGLIAALALAGPAAAFDLNNMTDAERSAFREEVHKYLIEHPEVLVEAVDALNAKQAKAQQDADLNLVKDNGDAIFRDGYSWVGGNPNGDITLVEFTDYRCAYCRKAYSEVDALVKGDGNIRFVIKEFPILGDQSTISAKFAIAVLQTAPEAYPKVHDALITMRGEVNDASLTRLATEQGLDAAAILKRMEGPEVAKVIDDNHALAAKLQINGTPTFVLQDQMLRGYVPLDAMKQIVDKVRG